MEGVSNAILGQSFCELYLVMIPHKMQDRNSGYNLQYKFSSLSLSLQLLAGFSEERVTIVSFN